MHVWNVLHAARWKYRMQKFAKIRHLGIIAQLCRAISLQLRHVSTIGKNHVKHQYLLHMSSQYGELRPTNGWDRLTSLEHPCKFQLVSRLGSITARHLVVGVSQTLRRWTEGATYIRQGGHHVGPTFLVKHHFVAGLILLRFMHGNVRQMVWSNKAHCSSVITRFEFRGATGRPRSTWIWNVCIDLSSFGMKLLHPEAREAPQNRPFWQMLTKHSATHLWWWCMLILDWILVYGRPM